jgi:DNA/RNA endonuclease YhcR with UshA esterase domain
MAAPQLVEMAIAGKRLIVAGLLVVAVWLTMSYGAIAFPQTCFIHQARHLPEGAAVTVTGRVTVPSGAFGSANLDAGFALQDVTGGIYVTTQEPLSLQVGDIIQVTGELLNDGHGQQMLRLTDWVRSQRPLLPISPLVTSTAQAGQVLDGQIVTVRGQISQPLKADAPYGDRLWIQDETGEIQIYMAKTTGIAPKELGYLTVGQWIEVTGFSSQFDKNDEVMPRSRADIVALSSPSSMPLSRPAQ